MQEGHSSMGLYIRQLKRRIAQTPFVGCSGTNQWQQSAQVEATKTDCSLRQCNASERDKRALAIVPCLCHSSTQLRMQVAQCERRVPGGDTTWISWRRRLRRHAICCNPACIGDSSQEGNSMQGSPELQICARLHAVDHAAYRFPLLQP